MWPFRSAVEKRESSFTDALVSVIVANAGGDASAVPSATGALEAVSGVVGRAFAASEVTGPASVTAALTPSVLALVGRELVRRGELVFVVDSDNGEIRLHPCEAIDVSGGYDARTWRYRLNLPGPSKTESRENVSAGGVLHFMYSRDASKPWIGVGPIQAATLAGRLSAAVVGALADEAGTARGYLLPIPRTDGEDGSVAQLKADLKGSKGGLSLVESMTEQWSAQSGSSTRSSDNWTVKRVGASPPDSLVNLADTAAREVFSACGISPALFSAGDGTAAREAWRQVLFGVIAPLGKMVSSELSMKFGEPVSLTWDELRASDLSGRARAFQSMVGGGMDPGRAAGLAGLMDQD